MFLKHKERAPTEAFATPAKRTYSATWHRFPKVGEATAISNSEVEMSTNSGNSIPKLESLEGLGLPNLIEWFTNSTIKRYIYVVEKELVFSDFVYLDFLKRA